MIYVRHLDFWEFLGAHGDLQFAKHLVVKSML